MKKQINPTIKAHLIRSAFYLLLLLGVCAIPFALAQRNAARQSITKPAAQPSVDSSEAISGLGMVAKPDFQGAAPQKEDVTKTSEAPVMANPDPEDSTSQSAASFAFEGAASEVQHFLQLPEVTCGAGNVCNFGEAGGAAFQSAPPAVARRDSVALGLSAVCDAYHTGGPPGPLGYDGRD